MDKIVAAYKRAGLTVTHNAEDHVVAYTASHEGASALRSAATRHGDGTYTLDDSEGADVVSHGLTEAQAVAYITGE